MMVFIYNIILSICLMNPVFASDRVKKVSLKVDELGIVKTAVGIATIMQFNEPIQTVIIGDQSAYKIEYLDKSITIKPLRYAARTNLYVNTLLRRYNLNLQTSPQDQSDYVVYIGNREEKINSTTKWQDLKRSVKSSGLTLQIRRIGKTTDGHILLDLKMLSLSAQKIEPEFFWISQAKEAKVINSIFMSSNEVSEKKPLTVGISLNTKDLISELPAILEVRFKDNLKIDLPREVLWKK